MSLPPANRASTPLWPQEAEHAALGSLLLDPAAYGRAQAAGLHGSHFGDAAHASIFSAVGDLQSRGEVVDVVSVFQHLAAKGQAERCGGLVYLNQLALCVPTAAHVAHYAGLVIDGARRRQAAALGERIAKVSAEASTRDEFRERLAAGLEQLAEINRAPERAPALVFDLVPLADLQTAEPQPQQWWWDGYVPAGHVTLWSGHGGAGKSTLALMLLACMAMGRTFLGKGTRRGNLLFFSAEDPGQLVRLRLRRVCTQLDIDPAVLAERLRVIDATELDAALYVEQRMAGVRHGATTPTYEALRQYVEAEGIDVLVLDNASDLFDGDEIVRTLVRGFIRSLAQLVRQRGGAVVLLAHVDKGTSRAGKGASSESYSGSTGWHNSVRSRLVLLEKEPGTLELQHQKCNLGPKQGPVVLTWPECGLPAMVDPSLPPPESAARPNADASMRALVALIRDYYARGEWVSTSVQSQSNASRLLSAEARYPRHLKPTQVAQLLREAQRAHFIEAETYRNANRKDLERWRVTAAGAAMVDNLPLFAPGGAP